MNESLAPVIVIALISRYFILILFFCFVLFQFVYILFPGFCFAFVAFFLFSLLITAGGSSPASELGWSGKQL